jgi:hypothetical protein
MTEDVQSLRNQVALMQESVAELELALEDQGWTRMLWTSAQEFSRSGLRTINDVARTMWLKNPLIKRGVDVQTHYVFGQGVSITAQDEAVNEIVQAFLDDAKNQAELTNAQAMQTKERELQLFANLFFVFFTDRAQGGRVRIRTIPVNEIDDIICNPEDAKDPWFYQRTWVQTDLDGTQRSQTVCYPDWRHVGRKERTVRGHPVDWDTPVYHVRVNALGDMRFGVSEVYSAIDWALAYKNFLEDWATLSRAYSRFAHKLTLAGAGSTKVAAATAQIEAAGRPMAGSTFVAGEGVDLAPMRIGGANVQAEDGRRILLMVCAALGLPESFMGDVSVGTLATAKSLDRPTELKMVARQTLWGDVFDAILQFVIVQAVRYGELPGRVTAEDDGTPAVTLGVDPETGKERSTAITVQWPPILEHDVAASIESIVKAATLGGSASAGTIPDERYLTRLLLSALGEQDVDALVAEMFPEDAGQQESRAVAAQMTEAVRDLRDALRVLVHGPTAGT